MAARDGAETVATARALVAQAKSDSVGDVKDALALIAAYVQTAKTAGSIEIGRQLASAGLEAARSLADEDLEAEFKALIDELGGAVNP